MKHFKVTVTRKRHYSESCEVEVCAADEDEATEKALAEAEEDGDWEWYASFYDDYSDTSVDYIEEIKKIDEAVEIERKETSPKRGEMPVDR